MKINYNKNIVSQTDSQLNHVLVSNRNMTENSLKMRVMAYSAQVKANLLTETIYELSDDKKTKSKYLNTLKYKNELLEKQKYLIEEQNKKLQKQIELEKELTNHKEKLWTQQTKMATLGDMIENIAHQWRQPLNVVSANASGIKLQKELGLLNDDLLNSLLDGIMENVNYLSDTINTFKDYIKENKTKTPVVLQDRIDLSLKILIPTIKSSHIKIINNIDYSTPIILNLVLGELSQIIINIINNANDVFQEKNIKFPWIKIDLKKNKNNILFSIEDNAGGIPEEIISKIFDKYFTTKNSKKGTGLGLYMCKKIITDSFKGTISVTNTNNGAKFIIELPIN